MCGTPQRSRSTSTGSFSPGTVISPSVWASTERALASKLSAVSAARSGERPAGTRARQTADRERRRFIGGLAGGEDGERKEAHGTTPVGFSVGAGRPARQAAGGSQVRRTW